MKQFLLVFWGVMISVCSIFGQSDRTVTTYTFEQNGAELKIIFNLTPTKGYRYNIAKVVIYGANKSIEVLTYAGKKENLNEGETFTIIWDVFKDTDAFERPSRAEISLQYTEESKQRLKSEYDKEQQKLIAQQKEAERQHKKEEMKLRAPFRFSVFGQGGVPGFLSGLLGDDTRVKSAIDIDISSFIYSGGAGLAFRTGKVKKTYLQIQGIYSKREVKFFDNYYDRPSFQINGNEVSIDPNFPKSKFILDEYRAYLKLKFGVMALGGYMSILQTAYRTSEPKVVYAESATSTGYSGEIYNGPFVYSLYIKGDKIQNQPLKQDYGFSLSFETSEKNRFLLGLGGDISIPNLINQEYHWNHFGTQDNIDFYPSKSSDFRWWMAYLKIGFRI